MNGMYFDLFEDSVIAATLIGFDREIYFSTMLAFGEYSAGLVIALAWLGSMIGSSANYMLGSFIAFLREKADKGQASLTFNKASHYATRYGKWLLLLSYIDIFGSILTVLAGVFQIRFRTFLLLVGAARAGYCALVWLM